MNTIISVNPANGETVGKTPITTPEELNIVVANARRAFPAWRSLPISRRVEYVKKLIPLIEKHAEEIALSTTREMGKPIQESRDEIAGELIFIKWYVDHAQDALGETTIRQDDTTIYKTVYEPWGVCASIAPWNFPTGLASSGITAQLLAGNTVIFKPSEYTTIFSLRFMSAVAKSVTSIFSEPGMWYAANSSGARTSITRKSDFP